MGAIGSSFANAMADAKTCETSLITLMVRQPKTTCILVKNSRTSLVLEQFTVSLCNAPAEAQLKLCQRVILLVTFEPVHLSLNNTIWRFV